MSGFVNSVTVYAPAASDYRGKEGCIVNIAAKAGGLPRVALATGASAQSFGVIEEVMFGAVGQQLRVADAGTSFVLLGDGWTAGTTDPAFMSDANGAAVPATAGSRIVGRLCLDEITNLAAGNRAKCIVAPGELET